MAIELPEPIAAYFAGTNKQDVDAMLALFAAAAVVKDEEDSGQPADRGRGAGPPLRPRRQRPDPAAPS